ncbi:HAD family hydrolase [Actinoallomurus rhizosphaericola]|uniref:HAD family hydrolase n=1 Tax=Actinoallomurus rhizosphaericola TaxID=2952536 RepID=UPI0020920638|nr:HAD family hydrolase [Actinoallomurus rhizosphaericola]MCO5998641.1 HAD hydrolase-like protein [Actinoallomurus rhizosphaericola]
MGDESRITLACLDLAGTTVADDGIGERAFTEALVTQGIVSGTDTYTRAMGRVHAARGRSKLDVFRDVFADEDRAQAANHAFEQAYDSIIDRVGLSPIPGAEAAIDALAASGVRICLMTGFGSRTLGHIIDTLGWWKRADLLLCPADAGGRGRPYPDMILTAALHVQVDDVRHIAVCGDTESDMHSGRRSGASIVAGTLTGAHDRTRLEAAGATHILSSVTELPTLIQRPHRPSTTPYDDQPAP